MAFATMTFPTTIFYSFQAFRLEIINSNETKKKKKIVGSVVSMVTF